MATAKAGTGGGPQARRTLKGIQENLNNGADPAKEAAAATVVPHEREVTTDVAEPIERIAAPDKPAPFDYDTWYKEQPLEAREQFARNVVGNYETQIKSVYSPEVFQLLEEAGSDPALMKKLQRASKDKNLRSFLFETAFDIYGDPETSTPAADALTTERKPKYVEDLEAQVSALSQERENEKIAASRYQYERQRTDELTALQREFPELRFDPAVTDSAEYLRVADIIDRTEAASQKAGKVLSYRDTYEAMQRAWGSTDRTAQQRVIPRTTTTTDVAPVRQAPINDKDSRTRMRETLERHGGSLTSLAQAISRGK